MKIIATELGAPAGEPGELSIPMGSVVLGGARGGLAILTPNGLVSLEDGRFGLGNVPPVALLRVSAVLVVKFPAEHPLATPAYGRGPIVVDRASSMPFVDVFRASRGEGSARAWGEGPSEQAALTALWRAESAALAVAASGGGLLGKIKAALGEEQ